MGERAHQAAVVAVVDAVSNVAAYAVDDVPVAPPRIYVEVHVARRFGAPLRPCGARQGSAWRITTRVVGSSVDEVLWGREKVAGVLDDRRVTVSGVPSKPVRFESETFVEDDDGWYSGATNWTYWL